MSSDHPLSDQELHQLRQTPRREQQVTLSQPRPGDLLDLPPLAQGELRRPAALVPRIQGSEPVGAEVADHIADPVLTGKGDLRDRGHVHALGRQQHHLRPSPGHHRPAAPGARSAPAAGPHHHRSHAPAIARPPAQSQRSAGPAARKAPDRANVTCYGTSSEAHRRPPRPRHHEPNIANRIEVSLPVLKPSSAGAGCDAANAKWRREREVPVPAEIDSSRRVFMGAHIRIGASATGPISPRLYFHDATAQTGRIYVGYLGRHLTNTAPEF
jgi:hypothetical protein